MTFSKTKHKEIDLYFFLSTNYRFKFILFVETATGQLIFAIYIKFLSQQITSIRKKLSYSLQTYSYYQVCLFIFLDDQIKFMNHTE